MSVSENSTLFPLSRDNDGSEPILDSVAPSVGDISVSSYKSPYTDPDIVLLNVGSKPTTFHVHRTVLAKSPELELKPFSKLWGNKANETLSIPDVDEDTAHTFVHYLYSGEYEPPKPYEATTSGAIAGYKLGTCVYCSSIRYKLPGLAELAREKIDQYGKDLSILNVLSVAREHAFPLLPDDETWYPSYLEDTIKTAVSRDPALFVTFASQMGGSSKADNKFREVVLKAIVSPISPSALPSKPETSVATPVIESKREALSEDGNDFDIEDSVREPNILSNSEPNPAVEVAPKETLPVAKPTETEEVKLDEIEPEPSPPTPAQPEPYTDEVGFGASKTYQSQGKKVDNVAEKITTPDSKTQRPGHARTDSVLAEIEQPEAAEEKGVVSPETAPEVAPVIVDGTNGAVTASKKKKKKGKKGNTSAAPAVST